MGIDYRRSRPDDRAAILEIMAEGKPAAHASARRADFDWQFGGQGPHDDGRSPFWVVTVDGEVAGINAVMPVKVRYRGEPALAVWSCETAVAARHRGKGFGKELLGRVSGEAEVVLGYGISDMSDSILARRGWELSSELKGLFYYANEIGPVGRLKNARSSLVRKALGRPAAEAYRVTANERDDFDDEVDELWSRSVAGYVSTVERDAAYLTWRYRRHPRLRYVAYQARRNGRLEGVLIARPDTTEAVIADYCGPTDNADLKTVLLDAAVSDLAERGAARIRCETTDRVLLGILSRTGFRETKATFRFRAWTNRPGDRQRAAGWFLMTGDSDNDLSSLGVAP